MNEQELCKKRLIDLSKQANRKGIVLFSDFLNLNEQNIYQQNQKYFETKTESFGGVDFAERQIIAFIPDALYYEWEYPIKALKITPSYPKFAEKLTHRDILGAIMHMGVDRGKIGDIFIHENLAYILCEESMADFFVDQLDKIRHTVVKLSYANLEELKHAKNMVEMEGIVSSNRLDNILACVFKLSRSQALELIMAEKAFVNGKTIQNSSYHVKTDEIISLRGYGRFLFKEEYGTTQKGRIKIRYQKYGD